jgi:hypothetical protein
MIKEERAIRREIDEAWHQLVDADGTEVDEPAGVVVGGHVEAERAGMARHGRRLPAGG